MRYYIFFITAALLFCFSETGNAQLNVSVNLNIGSQPVWGPVGYDYAQYYYLPDIEVYYDIPHHRYYYFESGRWIFAAQLPPRFHNFDLYRSYKVVLNEREPWRNHAIYREKYISFKGRHDQQIIRDSREQKYFVIKSHPQHSVWMQEQRHENKVIKTSAKREIRNERKRAEKQHTERNDRKEREVHERR